MRPRLLLPLTAALAVALVVLGMWIAGRHSSWLPDPLQSAIVGDTDTAVVKEAIDEVADTYYRRIPKDQLADAAIDGVVKKLDDRFSAYFDPSDYGRFQRAQNSEFTGVGVQVSQHPRGLKVEVVYDGSPAKRAGLEAGDVIVSADGKSLEGRKQEDAVTLVQGPAGSDVRLAWVHDGKRTVKQVTRSTVSVPVVASDLRTEGDCRVGVVRLASFTSGAHAEVYSALRRLRERGAEAFVLDLRDNGGGLVNEAQLVASAFLKDGPIVMTRGRAVPERTLRATGSPVVPRAPLVVLVDRGTASASEIVAGALLDRHRATIVGTRTFGKGVFQQVLELSNGGALDITAGQYVTPSGRTLGGRGVQPGQGLRASVRAADDPKTSRDEAAARAAGVAAARCS